MMIIGIAATPRVAAKSMNLFEGVAKVQKKSQSSAVNATNSLSPTIVLSTITTTTSNNMEKDDNTSILKAIEEDLEKSEAVKDAIPETVGMLCIKSANQTLMEAKQRPDPKPLWLSLWYEGEVCCLFADSNLGKSIYAVQIADSIAQTQRVLYFDFELSDKQFQLRYTDKEGNSYHFSDNFLRGEINKELLDVKTFEDDIINQIEAAALQTGTKVIIIDNLTWICSNSEKGDVAGQFMMKLTKLKKKYDLSLLIIAHTPKRSLSSPITQNDLAGSKKLYNFFDSCFSIGMSAKDGGLRYIKQMKAYEKEVKDYQKLWKEHSELFDEKLKSDNEITQLKRELSAAKAELVRVKRGGRYKDYKKEHQVVNYKQEHPSATVREIAKALGISTTTVQKALVANGLNKRKGE